MRKFITNGAILSSAFGFFSTLRQSQNQRRSWRAALLWASWGISLALAIAAVLDDRDEEREKEIARGHGRS